MVSFAAITLYASSQQVFVVYFVMTQSGNFWIHSRMLNIACADGLQWGWRSIVTAYIVI
jgi:hypothetical protein